MVSLEDQIKEIEVEIQSTPYNKATSKHIGRLKAKLAKLRDELQRRSSTKVGGGGYSVSKAGDATAVLVGYPSVGKSTLLNQLTDAESEVGEYDFTTLTAIPGMMEYNGACIQILDMPGLVKGAASGRGRGKEVLSVVRNADIIIFLVDIYNLEQLHILQKELYDSGVRLNTSPPDVTIKRRSRGGINISSTVELSLDDDTIRTVLSEYRIHNADILIRQDINVDQLIDSIQRNRMYTKSIVVVNKVDLVDSGYITNLDVPDDWILVSADKGLNLDVLQEAIYDSLDFIRIYLRPQGEKADMDAPMILRRGGNVGDVCDRLHRDFRRKFRYAQIWGESAKHKGQHVGLDHTLLDGDILTVIIQK